MSGVKIDEGEQVIKSPLLLAWTRRAKRLRALEEKIAKRPSRARQLPGYKRSPRPVRTR